VEAEDEENEDSEPSETGFHKHKIRAGEEDGGGAKTAKTAAKDSDWKPTHVKIDLPIDLLMPKSASQPPAILKITCRLSRGL